MSNNDSFDNKLRKKLQDFEPAFEEKAWTKFAPQVAPIRSFAFWSNKLKYAAYSAAAVALLAFGIQNYRLAYENAQLKTQKQTIANAKPQEKTIIVEKKDTIYVEKKSDRTDNVPPATQIAVTPIKENSNRFAPNRGISTKVNTNSAPLQTQIIDKKHIPSLEKPNYIHSNDNKFPIDKNNPIVNQLPEKIISPEKQENSLQDKTKSERKWQEIKPIVINENTENIENEAKPLKIEPLPTWHGQVKGVIVNCNCGHYPQFSIGTDFITDKNKKGFGGVVSMAINRHWSVNTGLNYVAQQAQTFEDEKAFYQATQTEFRTVVPGGVAANTEFTNIKQTESNWRLPISLQYSFPIYKMLSVTSALGTNVYLGEQKRYEYQYKEPQKVEPHRADFRHRPGPPPLLKRFPVFAGVGLQANWKRFQLQTLPFITVEPPKPSKSRRPEFEAPIVSLQVRLMYRL